MDKGLILTVKREIESGDRSETLEEAKVGIGYCTERIDSFFLPSLSDRW